MALLVEMCPDPRLRRYAFVLPSSTDGEEPISLGSNIIPFPVRGSSQDTADSERARRLEASPWTQSPCVTVTRAETNPVDDGRQLVRLVITQRLYRGGAELVVRVTGGIDLATVATLADVFDRARREFHPCPGALGIVADLRAVEFLSATGIRVLVDARDACLDDGLDFRVVAGHAAVVAPLSMTGLDRALNLQPDAPF